MTTAPTRRRAPRRLLANSSPAKAAEISRTITKGVIRRGVYAVWLRCRHGRHEMARPAGTQLDAPGSPREGRLRPPPTPRRVCPIAGPPLPTDPRTEVTAA